MPELPDVENMKRYLEAHAFNKRIERIHVCDDLVVGDTSPQGLGRVLKSERLTEARRHGKWLLARTGDDSWIALHFGMTGNLRLVDGEDDPPEHARILFQFAGGDRLAYISQRMLGEVDTADSPEAFAREHDLGPDALSLDIEDVRKRLAGRRGMAKTALMNQSVLAGIGNVYADEILFQSKVHPETKIGDLSDEELGRLARNVRDVLTESIDRGADARDLPRTWLISHRGDGKSCPRCDGTIRRIEVNGRGTYFCPKCQGKK